MGLFDHEEKPVLQVDEHARYYLLQTARWTKFLAISTIILLAIMLFIAIMFLSTVVASSDQDLANPYYAQSAAVTFVTFIAVAIIVVLHIYPMYALLRFSGLVKAGIEAEDQEQFNKALKNLFYMFRFVGILVIISIITYVLMFLFGVAIGLGSSF